MPWLWNQRIDGLVFGDHGFKLRSHHGKTSRLDDLQLQTALPFSI